MGIEMEGEKKALLAQLQSEQGNLSEYTDRQSAANIAKTKLEGGLVDAGNKLTDMETILLSRRTLRILRSQSKSWSKRRPTGTTPSAHLMMKLPTRMRSSTSLTRRRSMSAIMPQRVLRILQLLRTRSIIWPRSRLSLKLLWMSCQAA